MHISLGKGDRFKSIHLPPEYTIEVGHLTVAEAEENDLYVLIYKGETIRESDGSWDEHWNLQHTLWGFESGEYHSLKTKV